MFIAKRDKQQILCISFDEWTGIDGKQYLGVYLYCMSENICLRLIPFTGSCGGEKICVSLQLKIFILLPQDIIIAIVDCGSDVQLAARLFQWYTFPCLAHIINLIV